MRYYLFLKLTERVFGSHPYRTVSVSYGRASPFHGGNAGSNPAGDANILSTSYGQLGLPCRGHFGDTALGVRAL